MKKIIRTGIQFIYKFFGYIAISPSRLCISKKQYEVAIKDSKKKLSSAIARNKSPIEIEKAYNEFIKLNEDFIKLKVLLAKINSGAIITRKNNNTAIFQASQYKDVYESLKALKEVLPSKMKIYERVESDMWRYQTRERIALAKIARFNSKKITVKDNISLIA